ncbi:MAG: helix-turn-helix domain-containing protein [Leptothrix ochracea]|jgi:transcriptional regulator with XRE-family HTH domain|uniref:helix-turn-helix domain-containing protein n=1 Tax=Leptothrix ochracea TaxID=735331 RepID=UPI0034E1AAA3
MNIGHALKLTRSAKGLSLETLAERAELSQSYLSMIESGKREPTLSSIQKIATALGVPTPILIFLAADKGELEGIDPETFQRLAAAVMDVMRA